MEQSTVTLQCRQTYEHITTVMLQRKYNTITKEKKQLFVRLYW